jgi:hypothetical protein
MIDLQNCHEFRLLTTTEVAEALAISTYRVRKLAADGELHNIKNFRQLFFTAGAVRDFVNRYRAPQPDEGTVTQPR